MNRYDWSTIRVVYVLSSVFRWYSKNKNLCIFYIRQKQKMKIYNWLRWNETISWFNTRNYKLTDRLLHYIHCFPWIMIYWKQILLSKKCVGHINVCLNTLLYVTLLIQQSSEFLPFDYSPCSSTYRSSVAVFCWKKRVAQFRAWIQINLPDVIKSRALKKKVFPVS